MMLMTSDERTPLTTDAAAAAMLRGAVRAALTVMLTAAVVLAGPVLAQDKAGADKPAASVKPSLSVAPVLPATVSLPIRLTSNGSVAAWQEAILGAEVNGLRLTEVRANVGDQVKKGQVLAVFNRDGVAADLAQSRAALAEAQATLADAQSNAERARSIADSGALSSQQVAQYQTTEKTAQARVASLRAQLDAQQLRLRYTQVTASDDGVVSARNATLGAVVPQGQELFRLIRQNRLEWRGEVAAADLARLKPGLPVTVSAAGLAPITGKLRMIGPTVDPATRNALVYVDLPDATVRGLRPGMFAQGEFQLGASDALTLPPQAISLRDGFSYAFRIGPVSDGRAKVTQLKLQLGRRIGDRVEVLAGLKAGEPVVASGASFLGDGDTVKVVAP